MVDTSYASSNSRAHWAGATADIDIHLEAYEGNVDGSFRVTSMFRSNGLTNFKSVAGRTNVWRGDRVGGVKVQGRKSGEKLGNQRIVNDKFLITVDTTSYIRSNVDYQDDWTAPSFNAEYSAEHGSAHAKAFDGAHIIQLIKAGAWKAPTDLKASGAFYDGITSTLTGYAALVATNTKEDRAKAADLIVAEHKAHIAQFINRDLGDDIGSFITLMKPEAFNVLLDHDKLMNVQFQGNQGDNNFAQRRIGYLNGLRVVETPRFPSAAITDHILGPGFNVSAAEAKTLFVTFYPEKTLITVEAQPMVVRFWDDKAEFTNVLDSYTMYTVGIRRGDCTAVGRSD